MKILLTTLNAKFIHSSLSLAYLKAYCQNDFKDIYFLMLIFFIGLMITHGLPLMFGLKSIVTQI
ncbi:MAG: hypothetical protein PHU36_05600, partial [Syntrophomonadaceae bacterium]|nr:hypothetical protein [Syntrophomonadaceae bacterium]